MNAMCVYACTCVCIFSIAAMLQRPTAGHIIILFNAVGFVWPWQPDFLTELGAAGVAMLLSE